MLLRVDVDKVGGRAGQLASVDLVRAVEGGLGPADDGDGTVRVKALGLLDLRDHLRIGGVGVLILEIELQIGLVGEIDVHDHDQQQPGQDRVPADAPGLPFQPLHGDGRQHVHAHEAVQHERVDKFHVRDEEDAVHAQRQQRQAQGHQHAAPGVPVGEEPAQEVQQQRRRAQQVNDTGQVPGHKAEIAGSDRLEQRVVGQREAVGQGEAAHRLLRVDRVGQAQGEPVKEIVQRHGRRQHPERAQAEEQRLFRRLIAGEQLPDHQQQVIGGGHGQVGLIDARAGRQQQHARERGLPARPSPVPDGEHRQQQGQRIGHGGEEITEQPRHRGEADEHGGEHPLQEGVFDLKQAQGQAGGDREEEDAQQPVDPRHARVGEEEARRVEQPAAEADAAALAEQGIDLIRVEQLVGEGKAVGHQADREPREQRDPVLPQQDAAAAQKALRQTVFVLFHVPLSSDTDSIVIYKTIASFRQIASAA